MEFLFIVYLFLLLSLVLYLIVFEYYNKNVRENFRNNTQTTTSIFPVNELKRIDCGKEQIYCTKNSDCIQMCSQKNDKLQIEYKCSETNICLQSPSENDADDATVSCNRNFGFYPILTADEIFQPHWICLNTQPHIFNDNQEYHKFICAGQDRSKLDPKNIFDSCTCKNNTVKVHDEFRQDIPICINKHQLSLFPNFTQ